MIFSIVNGFSKPRLGVMDKNWHNTKYVGSESVTFKNVGERGTSWRGVMRLLSIVWHSRLKTQKSNVAEKE